MNIQITSSRSDSGEFRWIDITNPGASDLKSLSVEFGLHESSLQECMEPYHLPKIEKYSNHTFIILRTIDPNRNQDSFDVNKITRKIAIFIGKDFFITIHRSKIDFLEKLYQQFQINSQSGITGGIQSVCKNIISHTINSYDPLIDDSLEFINSIDQESKATLKRVFKIKKLASTMKRLLRLTHEILIKLAIDQELQFKDHIQDVKEDLENTIFFSEDLNDGIHHYLSLHLSMESQRTNETMRIMAIFSAFFMPITFIVGLYGMNFKNIPEINWEFGYYFSLILMLGSSLAVFLWFKKNKWL
jgi:magnesium transporter